MAAPKRLETNSRWRFGGETCTSGRIEVVHLVPWGAAAGVVGSRVKPPVASSKHSPRIHILHESLTPQCAPQTLATHSDWRLTTCRAPDPPPGGLYLKPTWNFYFTFYALFAAALLRFLRGCRTTPRPAASVAYSHYSIRTKYVAGLRRQLVLGEEEVLMGKGRPVNYTIMYTVVQI